VIKDTNSLLEFYYTVGGLLSIKVTTVFYVYTCLLLMTSFRYLSEFYVVLDQFCCFSFSLCRNKDTKLFYLMQKAHFTPLR
jgi:hypothetical protein